MKNNLRFNRLMIATSCTFILAMVEAQAGDTKRVSVNSAGVQGNGFSINGPISSDGRYVAFWSNAANLVTGDTNAVEDAFVRDRVTGTTSRVSVSSTGAQANDFSVPTAISADGRYVVFKSLANNLVAGDTNNSYDAFVRDRITNTTARISVSSGGVQGNDDSIPAAISADGRYVLFESWATNLVAGDTNASPDVFVRDRALNTTARVSVSSTGTQGNLGSEASAISADGRYIVFNSSANNLIAGDINARNDVFVRDRVANTTTSVSVNSAGVQANGGSGAGSISANGRYVAFESGANNLVAGDTNGSQDVFVRDRIAGTTTRASLSSTGVQGAGQSSSGAISADGSFVVFQSSADNLVATDSNEDADVFVRDRINGTTRLINVDSSGIQGNFGGYLDSINAISADGRYVSFGSVSDNLVAGDTNGFADAFVRDIVLNKTNKADLQVTVSAKPLLLKRGQTGSYTVTIKNNGPDGAGNVWLTDIFLNGTVTGITPSQGSCSIAAVTVCRLPNLAVGAVATVTFKVRANTNPLSQQISINAPPRDNMQSNNSRKVITPVSP